MPEVAIKWELDWWEFWQEGEALVAEEHEEVKELQGRVEPHKPDVDTLAGLHAAKVLHVVGARINGELGGYLTWTLEPNVESLGSRLVRMGAYFVRPKWAKFELTRKMFAFSMEEFKQNSPLRVVVRHPELGRARAMASLFRRYRLLPSSREYSLFLEPPHA